MAITNFNVQIMSPIRLILWHLFNIHSAYTHYEHKRMELIIKLCSIQTQQRQPNNEHDKQSNIFLRKENNKQNEYTFKHKNTHKMTVEYKHTLDG